MHRLQGPTAKADPYKACIYYSYRKFLRVCLTTLDNSASNLQLLLFSWKQNRGRLASKCSVSSPPSPTRKRKDSSKPTWRQDGFEQGLQFGPRHGSSSEVDGYMNASARNGVDLRGSPHSTSSTASECSEPVDDSPFSPVTEPPKRARSLSPENLAKVGTMKRRASKQSQF